MIVGGANVDLKCRLSAPPTHGTSNPGRTSTSLGGVGRNIAENLGRLGVAVRLVTAVGDDQLGRDLVERTAVCGVDVRTVIRPETATGTYTAVLDDRGELVIAIAAMDVIDSLGPSDVPVAALEDAGLVVVDANVPAATIEHVVRTAHAHGIPVVLEPVSVPKAARLRPLLQAGLPVSTVTPNRDELGALVGRPVHDGTDLESAARELHDLGVERVWVRLGARGSLLSLRGQPEPRFLPVVPTRVLDVTGAGDAMLAGYVYGLTRGYDDVRSAVLGHIAAALTLESPSTVRTDLTSDLLESRLEGASS